MQKKFILLGLMVILALFFTACTGQEASTTQFGANSGVNSGSAANTAIADDSSAPATAPLVPTTAPTPAAPAATSAPTVAPTVQPTSVPTKVGPELAAGINPLTGLPVNDPSLLDLPAIFLSIPNFPVSARPQAGLSFAPWTFEIYIGNGESRFLSAFYGEEPQVTKPVDGSCKVRTDPFKPGAVVLGNRAWLDSNQNGIQEAGEPGIAGICVTLQDASGNTLQTTSTNSNGYYGFNVNPAQAYILSFEKPSGLSFTTANVGLDNLDSDVNPQTGATDAITLSATSLDWDAGYVKVQSAPEASATLGAGTPTSSAGDTDGSGALPPPEVGPIRSMRLPFGKISKFFQGGCIVSASGDPNVLSQVPGCKYVFGDNKSVNDAVLKITDLHSLAENNKPSYPINYSGNVFDAAVPSGGLPANSVNSIWNYQNQALFSYDPLSGSFLRQQNTPDDPLSFTPQTDRLNGQDLLYSNVIVMYVEYQAQAETLMNINLETGNMGRSDLFRNGQLYHIYWDTVAQSYEQQTGYSRPIRFTDAQGNPFPLAPGHTWVLVYTTASVTYEKTPGSGLWTAEFHAPLVP
jgi:SdrD B-like domain/Protein of unknown function (DUF3048) C-terminal domain